MQSSIEPYLQQRLQQRADAGNKRKLLLREDGIDFFSNDYLGIVKNNILLSANNTYSTGATGSRLLSGNSKAAEDLEALLADFHQAESALLFNSGYDANTGLLSSIADRHTTVLYDEFSHASIIDGIRLSFCKQHFRFKHNDIADLEQKLDKYTKEHLPVIVVAESVYSMEGDLAPLQAITQLCKKYRVALIVDEAHATGIFGVQGQGLVQQLGLQQEVFARIHTFGKALGCHGAVVTGSHQLKAFLINFARSFIFTTALPEHAVMTIRSAYTFIKSHPAERAKLHENIRYFNQHKNHTGIYHWTDSQSPVQSMIVGNNALAGYIAEKCTEAKINISAIRSPTVAKGTERVRICLHSFNTPEDINSLLKQIALCLKK